MVEGILLIFFIYGFCIGMVHILHASSAMDTGEMAHYVLVCRNNEQQLEWIVRTLRWFHQLHGRSLEITIMDQGSMDQTVAMARCMEARGWIRLNCLQVAEDYAEYEKLLAERACLVLNLNRQEDVSTLFLP